MVVLQHFRGFRIKRKRRKVYVSICFFLCLTVIVGLREYDNERIRLTEEILGIVGHDRNTSAKVLPLLTDTTLLHPSHGCQALSKEAATHGDIIVDDLEENYYALPIKILRGLKWFLNNCHSSQFLVKVDEDVVLNLPKFAAELREWPDEYHLGGRIIKDGTPHLWNPFTKWFVPRQLWSGWSLAPAYLEGPCYVIRGDVVPMILEASYKTPIYHLEDVFITGMIANERLKLKQMTFKGIVKTDNIYVWYLQRYFFDLCNFTSLHTDQNYVMFTKIFNRCEYLLS